MLSKVEVNCRCGGSNENCRSCHGRGTYFPEYSEHPPPPPLPPSRPHQSTLAPTRPGRKTSPSPNRRKPAPARILPLKETVTSPSGRLLVPCPYCRAGQTRVRADRLDHHIRKVHPAKVAGRQVPVARKARPAAGGKAFRNTPPRPPQSPQRVTSSILATPDDSARLDGSQGFHQRRESGRFGSHPSFDRMDDESWS